MIIFRAQLYSLTSSGNKRSLLTQIYIFFDYLLFTFFKNLKDKYTFFKTNNFTQLCYEVR